MLILRSEKYRVDYANTKYSTTQYTIIKLEEWKGNTKLKFYQNISKYNVEMNYR